MNQLENKKEYITLDERIKLIILNKVLKASKIDDRDYHICDNEQNLLINNSTNYSLFLNKNNNKWLVYILEDGKRNALHEIGNIDDAINLFIDYLAFTKESFDFIHYNINYISNHMLPFSDFDNVLLTYEETNLLSILSTVLKKNKRLCCKYEILTNSFEMECIKLDKQDSNWIVIDDIQNQAFSNLEEAVSNFIEKVVVFNHLKQNIKDEIFNFEYQKKL